MSFRMKFSLILRLKNLEISEPTNSVKKENPRHLLKRRRKLGVEKADGVSFKIKKSQGGQGTRRDNQGGGNHIARAGVGRVPGRRRIGGKPDKI